MASKEDTGGADSRLRPWLVLLLLGEPGAQRFEKKRAQGPSPTGVVQSLLFPPQLTTWSVKTPSLINQEKCDVHMASDVV